jgi:hypothetical protein
MDKLGLRTTADLTHHAVKRGIISLELYTSDGIVGERCASQVRVWATSADTWVPWGYRAR